MHPKLAASAGVTITPYDATTDKSHARRSSSVFFVTTLYQKCAAVAAMMRSFTPTRSTLRQRSARRLAWASAISAVIGTSPTLLANTATKARRSSAIAGTDARYMASKSAENKIVARATSSSPDSEGPNSLVALGKLARQFRRSLPWQRRQRRRFADRQPFFCPVVGIFRRQGRKTF